MTRAPRMMADMIIAWLERFELDELKNEKQTALTDSILLKINRRAHQACRRNRENHALRDGQLALDQAIRWPVRSTDQDTDAENGTNYGAALTHFYAGALGLACGDMRAALGHFRLSEGMFVDLEKRRAESIAFAGTALAQAGLKKWSPALEAYRESIALIDQLINETAPLNSSLKDLRRQIVYTIGVILEWYEQEPDSRTSQESPA